MPQPDLADVHIDQPLTNISIASMNQDSAFIAQKVFPRVPVTKESDKYYVFSKSQMFRSTVEVRGPSSEVKHRSYDLSNTNYQANEYATGLLVPDRIANNSDAPLRPYEDGTTIVTHDMLMFIENNFAAEFLVTGTWTTNTTLSGTDQWSDYANSDPIKNIDDAKETLTGLTGIPGEMLSLAMGSGVWKKLKRHPNILNAFGGGNPSLKVATKQMVADLLEVKELIVSEAIWNTNNEGNATQTLSRIVSKNCLVYFAPASPSLMTPSCGYFFSKTVSQIDRYRINRKRSEAIEINSLFDFKATDVDSGVLIINAVA
jgi:hypothetical protein